VSASAVTSQAEIPITIRELMTNPHNAVAERPVCMPATCL
jgi:hypothetical protein